MTRHRERVRLLRRWHSARPCRFTRLYGFTWPRGLRGPWSHRLCRRRLCAIRRHGCAGRPRTDDTRSLQLAGTRRGTDRRHAVIGSLVKARILACRLDLLALQRCRGEVGLTGERPVGRRRACFGAALAAIIADVVDGLVDRDVLLVDVGDPRTLQVVHGAIVEECAMIPAAALIAEAVNEWICEHAASQCGRRRKSVMLSC